MIYLIVFGGLAVACVVLGVLATHDSGHHNAPRRPFDDLWAEGKRIAAAPHMRDRLDTLAAPYYEEVRPSGSVPESLDSGHRLRVDVTGPVPPSPEAVLTGPVTRLQAIEVHPVHEYAAHAWQTAGDNERARNWTPEWRTADPGDYSDTGWTKREAAMLAVATARDALARFDHIPAYATSGITPRWEGAA